MSTDEMMAETTKLADIPGYSEEDWQRDREKVKNVLACPNCARTEWFRPIGIPPEDGSERKYRACKVCGFWQDADGTPAYRCWMTVHMCLIALPPNDQCENCDLGGPTERHLCPRILTAKELGSFGCKNCDVILTPYHVIPWPVQAE